MSLLCPGAVNTGITDSERIRPEALAKKGKASAADEAFKSAVEAGIAKGSHPAEIAPFVFAALRQDKFWILPHPEFKAMVEKRTQSILDESNPIYQQDLV